MATATQLNLTLPNTMGTLARLCRDLADGGVNCWRWPRWKPREQPASCGWSSPIPNWRHVPWRRRVTISRPRKCSLSS
jgi:hypothetical protein